MTTSASPVCDRDRRKMKFVGFVVTPKYLQADGNYNLEFGVKLYTCPKCGQVKTEIEHDYRH